jgi:nucleotide-binding universal stress UspA family protein
MYAILVPCDGSKPCLAALKHAIKLASSMAAARIHVLNVQPPLPSAAAMFVGKSAVRSYHRDEGEAALKKARAHAERAGVRYESHIAVGNMAETIVAYAREKNCRQIVMGSRGLGALPGLLLGSVTTKVLHLADIPVTIVK